jgi:hypothetical protein
MRRLVTLLILAAAAYYAYDYFVVRGGASKWQLPQASEPAKSPPGERRREPGGGLNPFVTDEGPGSPPQRPRVPDIPGQR